MEPVLQVARVLRCGAFEVTSRVYAPRTAMPRHAHDFDKISMVVQGEVEERAGSRVAHCATGTLFVKPAGYEHSDAVGTNGLRMLVIRRASGMAVDELWQSATQDYRCRQDPLLSALIFPLAARLWCAQHLDGGEDWLILDLLARLRGDDGGGGSPAWARRARDALHAHFTSPVSVEGLAAELDVHPVHLARVFRRATNRTISQYVQELRVQHAASLLAQPRGTQSEIALACGFADQAHLCRLFRRHLGVTPGAYRRALHGRFDATKV